MKIPEWLAPLAPWALLIGVAYVAAFVHDRDVAAKALADHRSDSLTAALKIQTKRADSLGKAFRVDTVTLTKHLTAYRTLYDTLTHSDTVRLTVRESVFVQKADSAINACVRTIKTCEALQAEKDSVIQTLGAQVANERKRRPGFFKRVGESVKWVAAGVILGAVVTHD